MNKLRILITGGAGQLAQAFKDVCRNMEDVELHLLNRAQWDIGDYAMCPEMLDQYKPHVLINTAAYTAVDRAEDDGSRAMEINCSAPAFLAECCAERGIRFIHFSTDYVFNGTKNADYTEQDEPHPLNVYGFTKLQGEVEILKANPAALILRVSWLYYSRGKNFVLSMLSLGHKNKKLNVVNDQVSSPTYAGFLAEDCIQLLKDNLALKGIFHYSHSGTASWCEFANEIFKLANVDSEALPISTKEYGARAVRPAYSKLNSTKFFENTGFAQHEWREGLEMCIRKLRP